MDLETMQAFGQAPYWLTAESLKTLESGYLLPGETPGQLYQRVANAAAARLGRKDLAIKFFQYIWNGWLCPSTPVASNMGTARGMPISCFATHMGDSVDNIFKTIHEMAMLSKNGGGVAVVLSDIRGRGANIAGNGVSEGIIPWARIVDVTTLAVSQGSTRRGATSLYLDIEHPDIEEYLQIRKPLGDVNRQCLNLNHAVVIRDSFMKKLEDGDEKARKLWEDLLSTRHDTGEPYIMFYDNVNNANPQCYKDRGLTVETSNLCCEIQLHTSKDFTFVCCLSSLNLSKYDEWKDTDLVETSIYFLDGVMEEFLAKSKDVPGFERAWNFANKSRALGLGVLGWHTYLQEHEIEFNSFKAMQLTTKIFKALREDADCATAQLAKQYGEPEWLEGYGRRNTHTLAIAPTFSTATIAGNVSQSIEPLSANAFIKKQAKGVFIQKNTTLGKVLSKYGMDTDEVWTDIVVNDGSVQHLKFLSDKEKAVFLTARELNQLDIVKQAALRQRFIDQGQSLNLFFPANADEKFIHAVHMEAWRLGIKTLYYFRSESVLKGDIASRAFDTQNCTACEG